MNAETLFAYLKMCYKLHTIPSVLGFHVFKRVNQRIKAKEE